MDANQSLRGYYLYTGAICTYNIIEITLLTSKSLSRLEKASFNRLFTNRTLSNTVPIKVRCSSETEACCKMSINAFSVPWTFDSPGLLLFPVGDAHPRPWAAKVLPLAPALTVPCATCRSRRILQDDTSASSALSGREIYGGVLLSIIFVSRSPEEEDC